MQGERGVNLSGGQKARVSLARACYSASPLVLLDDPIAAVDVPTAKHLMDHVLAGLLKDRTVILVTHNKTSLTYCDRVFLMDHGKLQEIAKDLLLEGELDAVILDPAEATDEIRSDSNPTPVVDATTANKGTLTVRKIERKEWSPGQPMFSTSRMVAGKKLLNSPTFSKISRVPSMIVPIICVIRRV